MASKRKAAARKSPARKAPASRTPARKAPARGKPAAAVAIMSPCLWFDDQAEEAARFYVSVFPEARINGITRFPAVGQEIHGKPAGSVLTVEFVLNGMLITALNGGPQFKFNEAVSMQVLCRTQAEIDYYWEKLGEGGDPKAQACGWLKDRFGLSWQVAPQGMLEMWKDPDAKGTQRAFAAMLKMKKLDLAALKAAAKAR
jgi:predicted 3-demethylubiquinone-9 3-methyltransferase (glyoxalase superfamily)